MGADWLCSSVSQSMATNQLVSDSIVHTVRGNMGRQTVSRWWQTLAYNPIPCITEGSILRSEHAFYSYSPTSFRSDHHIVPCWLAECIMIWGYPSSSMKVRHDLLETYQSFPVLLVFNLWAKRGWNSSGLSRAIFLWRSDRLRLIRWSASPNPPFPMGLYSTDSILSPMAAGRALQTTDGNCLIKLNNWFSQLGKLLHCCEHSIKGQLVVNGAKKKCVTASNCCHTQRSFAWAWYRKAFNFPAWSNLF